MDKSAEGWRLRLLAVMKERGLTYRDISELSGMQYSTVQKHLSGGVQFESLWFLRKVCSGAGIGMASVLFGVDMEADIHRVPVLDDVGVEQWIANEPVRVSVTEWLPYPSMFRGGSRVFGWLVQSSGLSPQWPVGSWLYVDPELMPERSERRLVLVRMDGGLLVRYRELIAGEQWLVPESQVHQACRLGVHAIIGTVLGGVKPVDR